MAPYSFITRNPIKIPFINDFQSHVRKCGGDMISYFIQVNKKRGALYPEMNNTEIDRLPDFLNGFVVLGQ